MSQAAVAARTLWWSAGQIGLDDAIAAVGAVSHACTCCGCSTSQVCTAIRSTAAGTAASPGSWPAAIKQTACAC